MDNNEMAQADHTVLEAVRRLQNRVDELDEKVTKLSKKLDSDKAVIQWLKTTSIATRR